MELAPPAVLARAGIIPADLPFRTINTADGEPYMIRYWLVGDPSESGDSVLLHHILRSDDDRALHDHPWHFTTRLLEGAYTEVNRTDTTIWRVDYSAPQLLTHKATDFHRLELHDGPVWSLVCTGPRFRQWGFDTPDGWIDWRTFLGEAAEWQHKPRRRVGWVAP